MFNLKRVIMALQRAPFWTESSNPIR